MMQKKSFWGAFFLLINMMSLPCHAQLLLDQKKEQIPLHDHLELLIDETGDLKIESIQKSTQFELLANTPLPLSPDRFYWFKIDLKNTSDQDSDWMLYNAPVGLASLYIIDESNTLKVFHSGRNRRGSEKVENEGDFIHFPLHLKAGVSYRLYIRFWEIDHQVIPVNLELHDMLAWRKENHIPLEKTILFFLGIFGIMTLYNLVLFATVRFKAYLYYAGYLLCVGTFVLFATGPMTHPEFGDPRWLVPIGHLAFSAINIFYYLFGKSFLNLAELLPKWDRILSILILIKCVFLVITQTILYTSFNLPLALGIEFSLMLVDVLVNLVFFFALFKTGDRLAYYFIGGSGSVIVFGLSLAVLGHLFALPHTFIIFLSTIVIEIIFFSLGLGYRIRKTEEEKVEAERQKRIAQEALNDKLSSLNIAFKRFVPQEFIKSLGHKNVQDVSLGDGVEKVVTVLFSDIRDYTTLSEKMTPKENFDFLNTYLGRMGPAVQKYNGFVNQYYGDGIMALFPHSPEDGIMAAKEMMRTLAEYNEIRSHEDQEALRIGIGLHTGKLMMGVIGDADRMDASVVADTVNTASRMEGLTKHYGTPIILSDQTLAGIQNPDNYLVRFLGKVQVKGRKEAMNVHESKPFLLDSEKEQFISITQTFQEAMHQYYKQNFSHAIQALQDILSINPEDKASQLYLSRSLLFHKEGVPKDWSGVEMMQK